MRPQVVDIIRAVESVTGVTVSKLVTVARIIGRGKVRHGGKWDSCLIAECSCGGVRAVSRRHPGTVEFCKCPPQEQETELGTERRCKQCGDWWCLDQFKVQRDCHGGRRTVCKACAQEARCA